MLKTALMIIRPEKVVKLTQSENNKSYLYKYSDMKKLKELPSFVQQSMKTTTQKTMEKVEWPDGIQCPVSLSFDFDAQVGIMS